MTQLARRALLLVAFGLLASAATNYAEWVEDDSIDSEPIRLDSKDPRYSGYLGRVRELIKEKWGFPCVKDEATGNCEYKSAKLLIQFGILKNGRAVQVEVQEPSGYGIYDEYAVNAIKAASPFPPMPPELLALVKSGSAGIRILAAFDYIVLTPPARSR